MSVQLFNVCEHLIEFYLNYLVMEVLGFAGKIRAF
jgi:hypothetical protein